MNILIVNLILTTAEKGVITRRKSIKDTMASNFAKGFIKCGHSATILASEEFRPTEDNDYPFEVVYFKSVMPRVFKPALLPYPKGFTKWLRENKHRYDMVISVESFSIATLLTARVMRDKLIIWQELSLHQHKFFKIPSLLWYNVVVRGYLNGIPVIGNTEAARDFVAQYSRSVVPETVTHGVNGELLVPCDDMKRYFVILARLVPGKNIDKMIATFARFIKMPGFEDYHLNIIGDGEEEQNLKALIGSLGVGENVHLLGFKSHDEMAQILNKATAILINTSKDLSMVSVPESIVSGTPVLMNTLPCSHTYVNGESLGIAKDNWDEHDLAEMVRRYPEFHEACKRKRPQLTAEGVAGSMVALFKKYK